MSDYVDYKTSYTNEFLSMKCSGDVLNIVNPMARAEKEITESMSIIKKLRPIALSAPMKYTLIDLCAGNALTSVLAIHLLPFNQAIAVDKRPRTRRWGNADRFIYKQADIHTMPYYSYAPNDSESVIISSHACGDLSRRIIEIYNDYPLCKHLIMLPCCVGKFQSSIPQALSKKLGRYLLWCHDLWLSAKGHSTISSDNKCLSPCNTIITAHKDISV